MARLFASCDVFLGPSRREEGFGLPAAEAMASGVPVVLSEIPSFLSWNDVHDYASFAPEGDGIAMGERLAHVLGSPEMCARMAARGCEVVEQFRAERTAQRLEQWFAERISAPARTHMSGR
jgi:glycosyltransferase involved in cell wall biosynthesis